jgi:uncharacterized membrane protein YfcA
MPVLSTGRWVLGAITALLVGFSKSAVPGMAVVFVPLFAEVLPARASTGALLPLLILGDIFAVVFWRRHAVWRHIARLIPWALAGIVVGWIIMGRIDDRLMRPVLGAALIVILTVNVWHSVKREAAARRGIPVEETVPDTWWFSALFGLAGGVATMISNAAGAILTVYLLSMRLPRDEFIGTSAWYFLIVNVIKVPFSVNLGLITVPSLLLDAALAAGVAAGSIVGVLTARRIPQKAFVIVAQALAFASAVRMFF